MGLRQPGVTQLQVIQWDQSKQSDEQDQQIQPVQSSSPLSDGASRAEGKDRSSTGAAGVRAAPSGVTSTEDAGRSNSR